MLDAVSAPLACLRTPTVIRLEDGTLWGWEGLLSDKGCCAGSCSHVYNYQQAIPFLFPDLEKSLRDADWRHNQRPDGGLSFRQSLPIGSGFFEIEPCADGHFGSILKTYREWRLSGDTDWLKDHWPRIRKAIEFAWSEDNKSQWDPKMTGVLQGMQHNTLDMELFGPNGWLTAFYLSALLAASEMANAINDSAFKTTCDEVFKRGKAWVDNHLFNGDYFVQQVDLSDRGLLEKFARIDLTEPAQRRQALFRDTGRMNTNRSNFSWVRDASPIN